MAGFGKHAKVSSQTAASDELLGKTMVNKSLVCFLGFRLKHSKTLNASVRPSPLEALCKAEQIRIQDKICAIAIN